MQQTGAMARSQALVGRAAEVARLVAVTTDVRGERATCQFVMVSGGAGIGKTRLVDELVATAAGSIRLLRGRADEHEAAAFGLWLPVLSQLELPHPGSDPSVSASEQRWEVVDLLASVLPAPALLVLEDLHWADDGALWVLEQLLDRCAGRPLAVVATTRPSSEARVSRWHALYRRADVLSLDGLDVGEVVELASQLGAPDADARALWERTGGNPLFVREQILSGRTTMPSTIEVLLTRTIEQLEPAVADVVSLVAVAGPATARSVLAAAAAIERVELDRRIDEAVRADVLRVDDDGIRFRHDLLGEAASRRVEGDDRAGLHVNLAAAHSAVGGPGAEQAEARHRLLAVPAVDATVATDAALAVAHRLRSSGRAADSAALLHLAGTVIADRGDVSTTLKARVAVAEGEARWAVDDYDAAICACARAIDLAAATDDLAVVVAAEVAALTRTNPFIPEPARVERLAALDNLLTDDDSVDDALRIRLRGRRALLTMAMPDRIEEAIALGEGAVTDARELGEPDVLVGALSDRFFALITPADYDARAEAAGEILRLAAVSRRPELALLGHEWTFATRAYEGDLVAAVAALESLEILAAIMPSPLWRYGAGVRRAGVLALLGDYEGTLAMATTTRALTRGHRRRAGGDGPGAPAPRRRRGCSSAGTITGARPGWQLSWRRPAGCRCSSSRR